LAVNVDEFRLFALIHFALCILTNCCPVKHWNCFGHDVSMAALVFRIRSFQDSTLGLLETSVLVIDILVFVVSANSCCI
jgi:hypothetical protein